VIIVGMKIVQRCTRFWREGGKKKVEIIEIEEKKEKERLLQLFFYTF